MKGTKKHLLHTEKYKKDYLYIFANELTHSDYSRLNTSDRQHNRPEALPSTTNKNNPTKI